MEDLLEEHLLQPDEMNDEDTLDEDHDLSNL